MSISVNISQKDWQDDYGYCCKNGIVYLESENKPFNGIRTNVVEYSYEHYKNGLLHREDGPAVSGLYITLYCLDGKILSKEEFTPLTNHLEVFQ